MALDVVVGPLSNESHEEVALEFTMQDLRQEVQVRNEGSLEDDRDVGGVEELDGVGVGLTSLSLTLQCKFDSEALEVDDDEDHDNRGNQVRNIGRVLTVEGLLEGVDFILLRAQKVEQSNDSSFKLGTLLCADRNR